MTERTSATIEQQLRTWADDLVEQSLARATTSSFPAPSLDRARTSSFPAPSLDRATSSSPTRPRDAEVELVPDAVPGMGGRRGRGAVLTAAVVIVIGVIAAGAALRMHDGAGE